MSQDVTPFDLGRMFFHYTRSARRTAGGGTVTRYGLASDLIAKAWSGDPPRTDLAALVVQDLMGGTIVFRAVPGAGEHFSNLIPNGEDAYPFSALPSRLPIAPMTVNGPASRELLLKNDGVQEKYDLLRRRLAEVMRQGTERSKT